MKGYDMGSSRTLDVQSGRSVCLCVCLPSTQPNTTNPGELFIFKERIRSDMDKHNSKDWIIKQCICKGVRCAITELYTEQVQPVALHWWFMSNWHISLKYYFGLSSPQCW